jgi:membrane-bound lytic murein transglycosylase D
MQPVAAIGVQSRPMLRAPVIGTGLIVVALAAMGTRATRFDRADDGSTAVLRISDSPADEQPGEDPGVSFSLPGSESDDRLPLPPAVEPDDELVSIDRLLGTSERATWAEGIPQIQDPADPLTAEEAEEQFRFPQRGAWEAFSQRLNFAMASGSLDRLVALEPEIRAALAALRAIPGHVEYADWLEDRLQDIEVAQRAAERDRAIAESEDAAVPLYDVWLERMRDRPPPTRARLFVPQLKPIFAEAQLPPALVWIAETESGFNPAARSPAGARGLYQLMPRTARELGLRLRPHDQRLDPVHNARTAARYLAQLQAQFQDWPLALAAYHSGPTRVSRLIAARSATTFAEIADALPVETRLYVPKVLATLAVREGVTPTVLAMTTPGVGITNGAALAAE